MTKTEIEFQKSFEDVIEKLEARHNDRRNPAIEGTKRALNQFGRPDQDYNVILVGGTNGKGSTAEMISELLQSQGLDVGVYKSPHLVTARERIQFNSKMISEEEFLELYGRIASLDLQLTFFEFITVLAYVYFSDKEVDYAIMEVGMGGRLDATNAADNDTAVITNIGRDHMKYLGNTKEQIAREKAGIIPKDDKLITNTDSATIEKEVERQSAEMIEPDTVEFEDGKYIFRDQKFEIPLEGEFQKYNLENALKTVEELESFPDDLTAAFSNLKCDGRMETVSENPLCIHDGAHNTSALEKTVEEYPDDFICVFGAVSSKNIDKMVELVEEKASKLYITSAGISRAEDPEKIAEYVSKPFEIVENPAEAVEAAKDEAGNSGSVVVTGSLYLIGSVKQSRSNKVEYSN